MFRRVIAVEANDGRDKSDAIRRLRIAAEKIVLGQLPHHAIAAKQKGKRFDNCGLATVIRANEYGVLSELDFACPDASKIFNVQVGNHHKPYLPRVLSVG